MASASCLNTSDLHSSWANQGCSDNAEFALKADVTCWLWENGCNELFNGELWDDQLNDEIFYSLNEARGLIEHSDASTTPFPPRHLKSICASVAFPAWILGRDPNARVICVSYSNELAGKMARDSRNVIEAGWYKDLFKGTRISRRKNTEMEIETTRKGGRLATSIEGTLTGRGGRFVIIDDPIKPNDATSEAERKNVNEWFRRVPYTRLDDRNNGAIIIVMQRVHEDDLVGHVLDLDDWTVLQVPAMAEQQSE